MISELAEEFGKLQDKDGRTARNSVLPLIALKLHALWEFVVANFEPTNTVIGGAAGLGPSSGKINLNRPIARGQDLHFANVIDEQATKAWRRAGIGPVEDDDLNYFLQPFVGIEGNYVQLTATPRKAPYVGEQKLIESFRNHRLLVDVGDGLVRLVHQAVLDHWKKAADWLNRATVPYSNAMLRCASRQEIGTTRGESGLPIAPKSFRKKWRIPLNSSRPICEPGALARRPFTRKILI